MAANIINLNEMELIEKDLGYQITGAIFEVSHVLGNGFLEKVYQEALQMELELRGLKAEREKRMKIQYKGKELDCEYIADIVVNDAVIVELKAVSELNDAHRAQIINYLHATGMKLGILVNFGKPRAEIERFVNDRR